MASKKVVEIEVKFNGQNKLDDVTATILEQKQITIEFKKELAELERQLAQTPKTQLAAQKELKGRINGLKSAIKDQSIAIQDLNLQKQKSAAINKTATKSTEQLSKSLDKNRGFMSALNSLTGGLSNQIVGFYQGIGKTVKVVKTFIGSLNLLKGALIATGIGALVVALGTIVAYWDDITEAISGADQESKDLLKTQQSAALASQSSLDSISASENILKKQGKTEKEILQIKKLATNETITALEAQLTTQKQLKKSQVDTQTANKAILSGILKFTTAPLALLLKTIDKVGAALGKDFGLEKGLYDGIASVLFDPEATAKKADEEIKATEDALLKLKNSRAGFDLAIEKIDSDAAERVKDKKAKDDADKLAKEKKDAEDLARLKKEIRDAEANTEAELRAKQLEDINAYYNELILKAEKQGIDTSELKASQQEATAAKQAEFDQADLDAKQKKADEEIAIEKQLDDAKKAIRQSNLNNASAAFGLLGQLAGKNKALQAAALIGESATGIARTIINTQTSNAGTIAQGAALAIPTAGASVAAAAALVASNNISAGISIASNIAATAKGLASLKGGGSAPTAPSIKGGRGASVSLPESQTPSFNVVGTSGTNQLAETIAGKTNQPMKAYVVASDVSTAQSLERNIVQGASI